MRIRPLQAAGGFASLLCAVSALHAQTQPLAVRSRQIELHYQVEGAGDSAHVELWYTRDRGATWQKSERDTQGKDPLIFDAPAEGLYGIILIVRDGERISRRSPQPEDLPEQWIFVDATPPLLQWDRVEPGEDFAHRRVLLLSWSAHDDQFDNRPIGLAYRTADEQPWQTIEETLPNTGRYDWTLPVNIKGAVSLRVTARDRGGNVVERVLGPVDLDRWLPRPATQPAEMLAKAPATQPAAQPWSLPDKAVVDPTDREKARDIYQHGNWHLARGQYALAAERFREALELDPHLVDAVNALAGITHLQKNYEQSLRLYQKALETDGRSRAAMRGVALAYVGMHDYAESRKMFDRLLAAYPADAESLLDLGDVLYMMGDTHGARQRWQRVAKQGGIEASLNAKANRRLEVYGPADADKPADAGLAKVADSGGR